jgi:hypothetical protein
MPLLVIATAGAAARSFTVRKVAETAKTITLGWDRQAPAGGYRFYTCNSAGRCKAVSQTFDPARLTARFKKGPASFKIEVLRGSARSVGVYPAPGSESKLLWPPPELSKPTTIDVTNQNHTFALEAGHDYIIRLPSTPLTAKYGLVLIGGRNVVIIGGEIRQDDPISPPTGVNSAYGISLYRQTGTVHIEGVWVHGRGIGQAILIADLITGGGSPDSVVQIENSRLESLHPVGYVHTDAIQSYGGPGRLLLYQDTLISNGVTLQTQPHDLEPTKPHAWDYRRLNLVHQTPDAYALWKAGPRWSEYHEDVWLSANPAHVAASTHSAWANGDCWACWNPGGPWPITGEPIKLGKRPQGDFVPEGVAGIGYVTPGYR